MEPAATSEVTKLAGLKHGIYHPRLPTLRKMSMDTITHKLPTEHARTTTDCPSGQQPRLPFEMFSLAHLQWNSVKPLQHCANPMENYIQG